MQKEKEFYGNFVAEFVGKKMDILVQSCQAHVNQNFLASCLETMCQVQGEYKVVITLKPSVKGSS